MNLNEFIAALQTIQSKHGEIAVLDSEGYPVHQIAVHAVKQHQVTALGMPEGIQYVSIAGYNR